VLRGFLDRRTEELFPRSERSIGVGVEDLLDQRLRRVVVDQMPGRIDRRLRRVALLVALDDPERAVLEHDLEVDVIAGFDVFDLDVHCGEHSIAEHDRVSGRVILRTH